MDLSEYINRRYSYLQKYPNNFWRGRYSTFMKYLRPGINAHLESEGHDLEDEFKSKHRSENQVKDVEGVGVGLWLSVKLHGQAHSIQHDQDEDGVLEGLGRHKPPDFVLEPVLGDVSSNRFGS